MSCQLEPTIGSRDTGQRIPCFDRCQLIITWMSNTKEDTVNQGCMSLCQPVIWSMTAILRNSTIVVVVTAVVVRMHPRAIPLAMITMRKSTHFFFFCILIFIDFQFYIQFTTLTYYLLHSLTHTYIQAHTHPNNKSTKILKL